MPNETKTRVGGNSPGFWWQSEITPTAGLWDEDIGNLVRRLLTWPNTDFGTLTLVTTYDQ